MSRETKWVVLIVAAIVAGFFGMALSSWVASRASAGGMILFILLMLGIIVGIIAWALSGNRKVSLADASTTSAALAMKPAEGKASLFILRKGFVAMLQGFNFTIEGPGGPVKQGQAKGNQFLHADLPPGNYRITVKGKGNDGEADVSLAAGDVVVLRVVLEPGLVKGRIVLESVYPGSAQADLASVKMALWDA